MRNSGVPSTSTRLNIKGTRMCSVKMIHITHALLPCFCQYFKVVLRLSCLIAPCSIWGPPMVGTGHLVPVSRSVTMISPDWQDGVTAICCVPPHFSSLINDGCPYICHSSSSRPGQANLPDKSPATTELKMSLVSWFRIPGQCQHYARILTTIAANTAVRSCLQMIAETTLQSAYLMTLYSCGCFADVNNIT